MSATLDEVLVELRAVRGLLNRLLVPVEVEEARQLRQMSDEELKAHNRKVLRHAREKQRLRPA